MDVFSLVIFVMRCVVPYFTRRVPLNEKVGEGVDKKGLSRRWAKIKNRQNKRAMWPDRKCFVSNVFILYCQAHNGLFLSFKKVENKKKIDNECSANKSHLALSEEGAI